MVEQVTIDTSKSAPNPSLEEQAKAAGIDVNNIDSTANSQEAPQRPAWLPEKFKSEAELAAAYAELEKKLGQQGQNPAEKTEQGQEDPPKTEEEKPEGEETPEDQARKATKEAGIDYDQLSQEYFENGEKLSDQAYEKLEKAGIPRNLVDQFIAGQKAVVEAQRQTVFATVGGEQSYTAMTQWAAENLPEAEVRAYNDAVESQDMSKVLMAVQGLKARYEASEGIEPTRRVGGKAAPTAERYDSIAQMQADMADPKYQTDPAFRAMVERKLARSDIF